MVANEKESVTGMIDMTVKNKNFENCILAPVSTKLSPDRHPKPIITCIFSNKENMRGWILVDTGASVSLINRRALTEDNHVIVSKREKTYFGAGSGHKVKLHVEVKLKNIF